jgi:SAM-dependent methyltransferase
VTEPHESWADVYDLAYEESFGDFYQALTDTTIDQIKNIVSPPARVVDFGAGTGRLSIPLDALGYEVVAVEPCKVMQEQMFQKPGGEGVSGFTGKMQDFRTDAPFDLAICVFTVLLYLLDEDSLSSAFKAANKALRPGGYMLLDVPSRGLFNSFQRKTGLLQRNVSVRLIHDDIYSYQESITLTQDDRQTPYIDKFEIRCWEVDKVLQELASAGFSIADDLSAEFVGTGSRYYLVQK